MNIEKISEATASLSDEESIHSVFTPDDERPFPIDVLPANLREVAEHVSNEYKAPLDLVAPQVLAVVSASLGRGIRLITNHPDPSYGLTYMFIATRPGNNKSTIMKFLSQPLKDHQKEVRKRHRIEIESNLVHEYAEKKAKQGSKDWKPSKKEIDEEIGKAVPTLIAEHYSQEGLATTLSYNDEYLALISTDASGVIDMLKGSKAGGHNQGEILLKGYSGESYDCNNKVAADEHLEEIRMSINWLGTIETLRTFIHDRQIKGRGLLSRFCFAQVDDRILPSNATRNIIDESIRGGWTQFIEGLLSKYWRKDEAQVVEVSMSNDAIQLCVDFRNQYVEEQDELMWLESLPERWAENALRFALILHVCRHPHAPQDHLLSQETMKGAIAVMRWFIGREIACMEEVKDNNPEIAQCKGRVFEYLNQNGPTKVRDLNKRRKILKKEYNHLLNEWVRSGELAMWNGSLGNAPSLRVAIPGDDRIPADAELITNP